MNIPLYIARRYLVSKKSHNIINIISSISVAGVTIGTMSLIIVLSVFNGFDRLVISLFNTFNPDLLITTKAGKTFHATPSLEGDLRRIPGVIHLSEVVEENALIRYKDKQYIVTIKGVSPEFSKMSRMDTMMTDGSFLLQDGNKDYAILGGGVAYFLGANLDDYLNPLTVYVPNRNSSFSGTMENAFNSDVIFPSGFFSVQTDFDVKYVLVPIRFIRNLMDYKDEVTGLEIAVAKGPDISGIRSSVEKVMGSSFSVKDHFQQQEMLYKIMKSEKWAIFLILTFILVIATFNVIGSLSMLILDKKRDIAVLQCMGATQPLVKRIFLTEGWLISFVGACSGLILGAIVCFLQMKFGFVKLGSADSTFVVSSYPVHMQVSDFIFVFLTVLLIGFVATWYPVYNIRKIDTHILNQRF